MTDKHIFIPRGSPKLTARSLCRIEERIDELVKMDKRRQELRAAGDRDGLLALADEYSKRNMPRTANQIREEAAGRKRGRRNHSPTPLTPSPKP